VLGSDIAGSIQEHNRWRGEIDPWDGV